MPTIHTQIVMAGMLAGATALAMAGNAHASLISIGESAGGAVTTLATDGGTGYVNAAGSVGSFSLVTANATGAPILPQPTLNTASIDVSSAGAGTLLLYITEQGLSSPTGVYDFLSSFTFNLFNGSGIASVSEYTFISTSNELYGGTLLASATDSRGGLSTAATLAAGPALAALFSETVEYVIVATGPGSTNDTVNLSAQFPISEPATLGLFGAASGLFVLIARRRRNV